MVSAEKVKRRLETLVDLKPGWDGYSDSESITERAHGVADSLVEALCSAPFVVGVCLYPTSDGGLQYELMSANPDRETEIVISPDGKIAMAAQCEDWDIEFEPPSTEALMLRLKGAME